MPTQKNNDFFSFGQTSPYLYGPQPGTGLAWSQCFKNNWLLPKGLGLHRLQGNSVNLALFHPEVGI